MIPSVTYSSHTHNLLCLSFAFAFVPSPRNYCASSHSNCSPWCLHFALFVSSTRNLGRRSTSNRTFLLAPSSTGLFLSSRHHSYCAPHLRRGLGCWKLILVQNSRQILLTTCFGPSYSLSHYTVCLLLLTQNLYSSDRSRLARGLGDADGLGWSGGCGSGGACSRRVDDLHHRDCPTS